MTTATAPQVNLIKNLLADKIHTDSGKTILVGETRFRTTADKIDTISKSVASRMITALKAAPVKPAEERKPEGPHFRYLHNEWLVMGVEGGKPGDIIEVTTKADETRTVKLVSQVGITWTFENVEEVAEEETPTAKDTTTAQDTPAPTPRPVPARIQAQADKITAGKTSPSLRVAPGVSIEWDGTLWAVRSGIGSPTPGMSLAEALEVADARHRDRVERKESARRSVRAASAGASAAARAYSTGRHNGVNGQIWD